MTLREFEQIMLKCRAIKHLNPQFHAELDKIVAGLKNDKFTACIAGAFSHGKTRLLNQLLDTDIFPENALPSTTVLTEVSYGKEKRLVFAGADEHYSYELNHASLELFCAGQPYGDADGILAVQYPAEFLAPSVMLVDTPGLDDLLERRASLVFATLAASAAAIVTISALSPLSSSEKTFMESYLHGRAMPKMAIAVTFLDKLPERQAGRVLGYLRNIVTANWPQAEIWSPLPLTGGMASLVHANGIQAIRKRIAAWAADPDVINLQLRQAALSLARNLKICKEESDVLLDSLRGERTLEEQKMQAELDALSANSDGWLDLRREFIRRGSARARELQQSLCSLPEKIFKMAACDSRQDFETALRLNLEQIVAETSQDLQRKLQEDLDELLGAIRGRYGIEPVIRMDLMQIRPDFSCIKLPVSSRIKDVFGQMNWLHKAIIDKVVIFLPVPPIVRPILRQIAHWFLDYGKNALNQNPETDKEKISAQIKNFLASLGEQILELVETLYGHIADEIRKEQDNWLREQQRFLEKTCNDHDRDEKIDALSRTAAEISSVLALLPQNNAIK